jgi:ribosomal protein S18 acetylase RimI-like enzyme
MSSALVIRVARFSDIDDLSDLAILTYKASFGHTFTQQDLDAHLSTHLTWEPFERMLAEDVVLVAELDDRLIGYTQFGDAKSLSVNQDERELRRLYIHPESQNMGYGSALMEAALSHTDMRNARTIYLDVWEHNIGALRFYKRFGFEVVGTRDFKVESGAETSLDLVMLRHAGPVAIVTSIGIQRQMV